MSSQQSPLGTPAGYNFVAEQPAPAQATTPYRKEQPILMRLRGGCIPCPVRFLLWCSKNPITYPNSRTAVAALSFPVRAVKV